MSPTTNPNELFEQAARMFETALQAGITVQRESTKWLTEALENLGSPQQWQSQTTAVMEEGISMARKTADEAVQTMNETAKMSLDLLDKALKARLPESSADVQARTREALETAMGSLRKGTEAMLRANSRVVESWSQIAKILLDGIAAKQTQPS